MKWICALAIGLAVALSPGAALAAPGDREDSFLLRIGADVVIARDETVGSVVVIDGNLLIAGRVTGSVVVVDGDADVQGTIEDDLTVVSGTINLRAGSSVGNVTSIRGDLFRAERAVVTGEVTERDNFQFFQGIVAVFSILFWLAMSIAVVVAGLVFAAAGGGQLTRAARVMTGNATSSLLGVLFVWLALPVAAGLAIATLIGLPLGLGVLIFLLPALWFLGYIVAATRLGIAVTGLTGRHGGERPYLAVAVGLILLQLLILVPALGGLVAFVAGLWGAGALAVIAYRSARGQGTPATGEDVAPAPEPAA